MADTGTSAAADRWRESLASWAIPSEIIEAAPESPHGFSSEVFARSAHEALRRTADSPSDRVARAALPQGGSVLDVGCGGGAGSIRLATQASAVVGVDSTEEMLEVFRDLLTSQGASAETVAGRWPDVAAVVPVCDVVVSHHVVYNVPDLPAFATALTDHARHRVVLEATVEHPLTWMAPYWRVLHDLDRPTGPILDDLVAVLVELGLDPVIERWRRSFHPIGTDGSDIVASLRRRLCVSPERDDEVRQLTRRHPPPREREVATLWWAPTS